MSRFLDISRGSRLGFRGARFGHYPWPQYEISLASPGAPWYRAYNIEEEKKLASGSYREEIARYLEEGIVAYLNQKYNNREVWYGTKRVTNQER